MKRYKVIKDFLDDKGVLHLKGYEFESDGEEYATRVHFWELLKQNQFIEEIPEQPKTVWDLEGDMYCWVIGDDSVWAQHWCQVVCAVEKRNQGDIYLTQEEAQKELARRKAKQILLRDTKGFKPDWSNGEQLKYCVLYTFRNNKLMVEYHSTYHYGIINFASEEDAEASIKVHEKEWKIYLGVEE